MKKISTIICIFCIISSSSGQNKVMAQPDDKFATDIDRQFIMKTYEIAKNAVLHKNPPFGALLVHDGKIIAEFENETWSSGEITKHAETGLIALASKTYSRKMLSECTIYASTEPCLMCCGAIYWAGFKKIVFGTSNSQMEIIIDGHSNPQSMSAREIFQKIKPGISIIGPVLEKEGIAIHEAFWLQFKK